LFDAMKLLGSLLEGQAAPATAGRFDTAAQFAGYPPAGTQQPASGGIGNFGAGGLGAVAGALLGKSGPGMIGGGLMGIVGNIALQALQARMAAGSATAQVPPPTQYAGYNPAPADGQRKATLIIRAMIQSAKADGVIDAVETQRIMGKIDEHGNDPSGRAFVAAEMAKPIDMQALCRDVTSPQEAAEVYAASLMVLDVDSPAERDYLADLASNLGIAPQAVAQIHQALGVA
jgi:uncharacterized membrane protein YebE (DUF533 family)